MLCSVIVTIQGKIMKVLIFLVLASSYVFASNSVEFNCYNEENQKVLSIVGLVLENNKIINVYDNREEFNPSIADANSRIIAQYFNNGIMRTIHSEITIDEEVTLEEDGMELIYTTIIKGKKRKMRRYSSSSNHNFELKSIDGTYFEGTLQYYVGSSSRRRSVRESFTCQI